MKCYPLIALLILSSFVAVANSAWHIIPDVYIPPGTTHLGDEWISTTNTLLLTAWFEDNWVNYTVSASGVQQVYNGSKPYRVFIDGTSTSEGSGWSYGSGIVTVSTALSSVGMEWGTAPDIPPPAVTIYPFTPLAAQTYDTYYMVYGTCVFDFDQYQKLACQHTTSVNLQMVIVSGSFNGSGNVALSENHGILTVNLTTDSVVQFSDLDSSGLMVKVNGAQVNLNENIAVPSMDNTVIEWTRNAAPLIPFMLIMGLSGLACLFYAPIYLIQKFREHEYEKAMITGLILGVLGFAMFIGWLWSSA